MNDRERSEALPAEPEGDRIEVQDSGQTLEEALAEEERSAIAAAEEKLHSVQKDLAELKDRHLRKLAEFENMKRRSERERREYFTAAVAEFARDLLPVVDNFERALAHASTERLQDDFGQGIVLIHRQLLDLWKHYGLTEVDTFGAFDPNVHEAVVTEVSDEVPHHTILGVLRKGYFLNDRLIRPASVKVSVRPTEFADESDILG